jgi:integrase
LIYRRASEAMKKAGVPLDVGAIQFARSLANSNGSGAPIESATSPSSVKAVSVAMVVQELFASEKAKGRSHLYLTDLRLRLKRFAEAFKRPLYEIISDDIDQFLAALGIAARSQNNFRATIGTLIYFGQTKGYVAWDHPGIRHVDRASHVAQEIQVFTPEEMEKLLGSAKNELVPVMAIGAFAGIRSEEMKRLTWDDIHLKEGHIEIRSAKSKTKAIAWCGD